MTVVYISIIATVKGLPQEGPNALPLGHFAALLVLIAGSWWDDEEDSVVDIRRAAQSEKTQKTPHQFVSISQNFVRNTQKIIGEDQYIENYTSSFYGAANSENDLALTLSDSWNITNSERVSHFSFISNSNLMTDETPASAETTPTVEATAPAEEAVKPEEEAAKEKEEADSPESFMSKFCGCFGTSAVEEEDAAEDKAAEEAPAAEKEEAPAAEEETPAAEE